jgi:hypothetical protein
LCCLFIIFIIIVIVIIVVEHIVNFLTLLGLLVAFLFPFCAPFVNFEFFFRFKFPKTQVLIYISLFIYTVLPFIYFVDYIFPKIQFFEFIILTKFTQY